MVLEGACFIPWQINWRYGEKLKPAYIREEKELMRRVTERDITNTRPQALFAVIEQNSGNIVPKQTRRDRKVPKSLAPLQSKL